MSEALEKLETRLAYSEDLLETLNKTVYAQQREIERLHKKLRHLSERLDQSNEGASHSSNPADDIPPHY